MRGNIFERRNSAFAASNFFKFRRRKRGNFLRKNEKIAQNRRRARPPIVFEHFLVVRCFLKFTQACLQPIFCICGVDFSKFCGRKRFNFQPKIRRSRAIGVAHPRNLHFETALVLSRRALALKLRENILKTEFPRLRRRIFKFSASKTRQFFAETFENRAKSAVRASANRTRTFSCRALLLKVRAILSATEFLHLRH